MKEKIYQKICNPEKLRLELLNAGFISAGMRVDYGPGITTVYLDDAETKDPTPFVEAHQNIPYKDIDWIDTFSKAKNVGEQVKIMAKKMGLSAMTVKEKEDGVLVI